MEQRDGRALDDAVRAVLAGDRARYREVVDACELPVRVVAAAMLPDATAVDELVHEAFVTAYTKLGEYRPGTDLLAWLKSITRNLAQNERRRWARREGMKRRYRVAVDELLAPSVEEMAAGLGADVVGAVRECVEALAEPARRLVRERYFEGREPTAMAKQEGRPGAWVRLVLFRARTALLKCLEGKGVLEHV